MFWFLCWREKSHFSHAHGYIECVYVHFDPFCTGWILSVLCCCLLSSSLSFDAHSVRFASCYFATANGMFFNVIWVFKHFSDHNEQHHPIETLHLTCAFHVRNACFRPSPLVASQAHHLLNEHTIKWYYSLCVCTIFSVQLPEILAIFCATMTKPCISARLIDDMPLCVRHFLNMPLTVFESVHPIKMYTQSGDVLWLGISFIRLTNVHAITVKLPLNYV